MSEEYAVGLYAHNASSYEKVRKAFETEDVVGIVHATGTGKSFNALQLAYDNRDKEIVYVVPSNSIIEHLEKIIDDNPNLDRTRDFPNLHFRTYQSFINLSSEEMESIPCDFLILDEFHHIGAPIWGSQIEKLRETHPNIKTFGMTAYTIRDRGTMYERDMANPEGEELFSNKIVSRYDLCDAMIDGVLPKPIYKSAYVYLTKTEEELEKLLEKMNHSLPQYQILKDELTRIKRKIQAAPSIPELLKKNIKRNGKYIYFCPALSEEGTNDIETIKRQVLEWFREFIPEEDIIFYTSTSEMGEEGRDNREAFYNDETLGGEPVAGKLRIMFAINQYNEGVHAPNIDGVILGRTTASDIVYFEQLGRALSVRGNTKEEYERLDKYTIEELLSICLERGILIKSGTTKEEIIEKLLAPIIIDLANNISFIRQLETILQGRLKAMAATKHNNPENRTIKISDASFDITIENEDLFEILSYVRDSLTNTWEAMYELAKAYFEYYQHLDIPSNFKTSNGYEYDENGVRLGQWISVQRRAKKGAGHWKITQEQIAKLEAIGMQWLLQEEKNNARWEAMYELAKAYFEYYQHLDVPSNFKTSNGYEYDENGVALGQWISVQRRAKKGQGHYKITLEQIAKLEAIGMQWLLQEEKNNARWEAMYELAKAYYEHHHNLDIPHKFKTSNGYEYDENGVALGKWISHKRAAYKGQGNDKITQEQIAKLEAIGMKWNFNEEKREEMYELAASYFEHHQNLNIPQKFKTINGYEYDENGVALGVWIDKQKQSYKGQSTGKITSEQIAKLEAIGMQWFLQEEKNNGRWEEMYELAKAYKSYHGHLLIPSTFKTTNGYEYDENGAKLGQWISVQRRAKKGAGHWKITQEQIAKLESIGMIWDIKHNKQEISDFCDSKGIDFTKNKNILASISIRELQIKTSFLEEIGEKLVDESGKLHPIFSMSNPNMKETYGITLEDLYAKYYVKEKEEQL